MPTLIYLSNKHYAFSFVLIAWMVYTSSFAFFSIANFIILAVSLYCFKKIPLLAIPVYSISIDTVACVQYSLQWLPTVWAGLLWNMKWIVLSVAIEAVCYAYKHRSKLVSEK